MAVGVSQEELSGSFIHRYLSRTLLCGRIYTCDKYNSQWVERSLAHSGEVAVCMIGPPWRAWIRLKSGDDI